MIYKSSLKWPFYTIILFFLLPPALLARQTVITGSLGVGLTHQERTYDDESSIDDPDEGDRREAFLQPGFEIDSTGQYNTVLFSYSPTLVYDDLYEENEVDHNLDLDIQQSLSRAWTLHLSDNYVYSSDPERNDDNSETVESDNLTTNLDRTKYWTNNLTLESSYSYKADSDLTFGYSFNILRNDSSEELLTDGYDEFDRHEIFTSWSNRINAPFTSVVDLRYIKGLYDEAEDEESNDLKEYHTGLSFIYEADRMNSFPLSYSAIGTSYENDRNDYWVHQLSLGWNHAFDSRTNLEIQAGASYIDVDTLDAEWGYTGGLTVTRLYQHGSVAFSANKSYEPQNFTGSEEESGLTERYDINLDFTYQFNRDIETTLFAHYMDEKMLDPSGDYLDAAEENSDSQTEDSISDISYNRDSFEVGGSIGYSFMRDYRVSLEYSYLTSNGDLEEDCYNEQLVQLQITGSWELWRR